MIIFNVFVAKNLPFLVRFLDFEKRRQRNIKYFYI